MAHAKGPPRAADAGHLAAPAPPPAEAIGSGHLLSVAEEQESERRQALIVVAVGKLDGPEPRRDDYYDQRWMPRTNPIEDVERFTLRPLPQLLLGFLEFLLAEGDAGEMVFGEIAGGLLDNSTLPGMTTQDADQFTFFLRQPSGQLVGLWYPEDDANPLVVVASSNGFTPIAASLPHLLVQVAHEHDALRNEIGSMDCPPGTPEEFDLEEEVTFREFQTQLRSFLARPGGIPEADVLGLRGSADEWRLPFQSWVEETTRLRADALMNAAPTIGLMAELDRFLDAPTLHALMNHAPLPTRDSLGYDSVEWWKTFHQNAAAINILRFGHSFHMCVGDRWLESESTAHLRPAVDAFRESHLDGNTDRGAWLSVTLRRDVDGWDPPMLNWMDEPRGVNLRTAVKEELQLYPRTNRWKPDWMTDTWTSRAADKLSATARGIGAATSLLRAQRSHN